MRSILSTSILVSFCLANIVTSPALAENLTQVKKSIEAIYLQKNNSTKRKDLAGMMSIYAPGATIKYPDGKVLTKGDLEKELVSILPNVKSVIGHDVVKNISLKGDTALVQSSRTSTTVTEEPESHKQDRVVHSASTEDTWVKIGDKWLLKEVRVLKANSIVNGKPINDGH